VVAHSPGARRDEIEIDIPARRIHLKVDDAELQKRREAWAAPEPRITSGFLGIYARLVSTPHVEPY